MIPVAYVVNPLDISIRIEATCFDDSDQPITWAIRQMGSVLTKSGEWEWESQPSSRTEEFLKESRWKSAEEAAQFLKEKYFTKKDG